MNQPTPRRVLLNELPALVGTTLGNSGSILITQEHIDQFANVTLDRQWLHVDPERAASGPFGSTVAHGHLTLALGPALLWQVVEVTDATQVVNYGLNKVRFPAPLRVGSSVSLKVELLAADPVDNGYQLTFRGSFHTAGQEKPVCVAEGIFRYYGAADESGGVMIVPQPRPPGAVELVADPPLQFDADAASNIPDASLQENATTANAPEVIHRPRDRRPSGEMPPC